MYSTPTVVGDLLIVASCNGRIRALDRNSGQVKWEYDITKDGNQHEFHADPIIAGGLVVIGTDGEIGHVYALELSTGRVRWKYKVDGKGVSSDVARSGRNIYAVTLRNELLCLDLDTGKLKWHFQAGHSDQFCLTCSSPAADGRRVYFGGLDGFAYALSAESGSLIWKRDLGAGVTTSAALWGNDLYLGTANRHLYRLDADSGEVLADIETRAEPTGHLVVSDDSLLAFIGYNALGSFDLELMKLRWSSEIPKPWTSARPYLWHHVVLLGNRGQLIALRSTDGEREWSHEFAATIRSIGNSPSVLYVGTLHGLLLAYSRQQ